MARILIIGATGFIGSHLATDLKKAGHVIIACARDISRAKNMFPQTEVIKCDFSKDVSIDDWIPRLKDIDVVLNCVGILYHPFKSEIWKIHYDIPKAIYDACVKTGVDRIIHISALGVDKSDVEYATSKKAAEEYLQSLSIASIILRPSLVYGRGSYGGTSLFRGLAGLPFVLPVPGKGEQTFQPIHLDDLSLTMQILIDMPVEKSLLLTAVGQEQITLINILKIIRSWLGFQKAITLFIPYFFIRVGSFIGNLIPNSAMNTTSYKMMRLNNIASVEQTQHFHDTVGFIPRPFAAGVYSKPSTVQDHWHARLFFLKDFLQFALAFVWIFSGIVSAFFYPLQGSFFILDKMGFPTSMHASLLYSASALDVLLGLWMLIGWKPRLVSSLQIAVMLGYTFLITWKFPAMWNDPLAGVAKNLPILAATLVFMAICVDR